MISAPSRKMIAQLIRMLSSDNDGEVLNAVAAIKRQLKKDNHDLHYLADEILKGSIAQPYTQPHRPSYSYTKPETEEQKKLKEIKKSIQRLNENSQEFIESVSPKIMRGQKLTEKQQKWFDDIYFRLCV